MNTLLRELVRQKFELIPEDDFNQVPIEGWVEMLSLQDQLEITERLALEDQKVMAISELHKRIPLDVWGLMLKDSKNSTLRALCRSDRFFRENCAKLIEKIGILRHGDDFQLFNSDYPVEALIAWEIRNIAMDVYRDKHNYSQFYFRNKKKKLEMELVMEANSQKVYGITYTVQTRVLLKNANTKIDEFTNRYFYYNDKRDDVLIIYRFPTFDELLKLLVKGQYDLYEVYAQTSFDVPINKNGKTNTYRKWVRREDTKLLSQCISCKTQEATNFCGHMCTKDPIYCSQDCAQKDWENHRPCK